MSVVAMAEPLLSAYSFDKALSPIKGSCTIICLYPYHNEKHQNSRQGNYHNFSTSFFLFHTFHPFIIIALQKILRCPQSNGHRRVPYVSCSTEPCSHFFPSSIQYFPGPISSSRKIRAETKVNGGRKTVTSFKLLCFSPWNSVKLIYINEYCIHAIPFLLFMQGFWEVW